MTWRRHLLGLVAMAFLGFAFVQSAQSGWSLSSGSGLCIRVGVLLAVLWLALPELHRTLSRIPTWLLGMIGIGLLAVIYKPKLLWAVIPLIGVLLALHAAGRVLGLFGSAKKRHE